ncbi:MAG: OsmC family protein [Candidatus Kapabacteria bacterium]|nr:OsmC family protein [Candidatus Kapabacteria bacterium]
MNVQTRLDGKMRIVGSNSSGYETAFDTLESVGGDNSAATPMEILLQALGACTTMDIVSILRKKRKTVNDLKINIEGNKSENHPKVFQKVHLSFELHSPDAEMKDFERAVELSQTTYCSVAATLKRSGCDVSYSLSIIN